jgi:hypothetical protein
MGTDARQCASAIRRFYGVFGGLFDDDTTVSLVTVCENSRFAFKTALEDVYV